MESTLATRPAFESDRKTLPEFVQALAWYLFVRSVVRKISRLFSASILFDIASGAKSSNITEKCIPSFAHASIEIVASIEAEE